MKKENNKGGGLVTPSVMLLVEQVHGEVWCALLASGAPCLLGWVMCLRLGSFGQLQRVAGSW